MNQKYPISVVTEIAPDLHKSLIKYLEQHPYWDLDRVFNASLSLFLLQNWSGEGGMETEDKKVCSQVYLDCIFKGYSQYRFYERDKLPPKLN